jgi:hypothetical protein
MGVLFDDDELDGQFQPTRGRHRPGAGTSSPSERLLAPDVLNPLRRSARSPRHRPEMPPAPTPAHPKAPPAAQHSAIRCQENRQPGRTGQASRRVRG